MVTDGHKVIGEIEEERLSSNALARCTKLIPVKVPPQKVAVAAVQEQLI